MALADVLAQLRNSLPNDEVFMSFNKMLTRIRNEFDYAKTNAELTHLHSRRAGRDLYLDPSIPKSDRISKANLQQIADRARIVEIGLPVRRYRATTKRNIRKITKYLLVEREDLFADIRHKTTREDVIECLLREAYDLEGELEAVVEGIDELTTDIDKASYNLRDTVDLLATVHRNLSLGKAGD